MTTKIYIPRDSSALSVGAEKVATAVAAEAKKTWFGCRNHT